MLSKILQLPSSSLISTILLFNGRYPSITFSSLLGIMFRYLTPQPLAISRNSFSEIGLRLIISSLSVFIIFFNDFHFSKFVIFLFYILKWITRKSLICEKKAKRLGIKGFSRLRKQELINSIRTARNILKKFQKSILPFSERRDTWRNPSPWRRQIENRKSENSRRCSACARAKREQVRQRSES